MKISVIGTGNLGSEIAFMLAQKGLGDIVLLDINKELAEGHQMDIEHASSGISYGGTVNSASSSEEIAGSDLVIVTAGAPRQPGMSREDLLAGNATIIKSVCADIKKNAPDSIVLVTTNPSDLMLMLVLQETGFSSKRVLGLGNLLDSYRLRSLIAIETGKNLTEVEAIILGQHGDRMLPVLSSCKVSGKPLSELLDSDKISKIFERTKSAASELISKKGATVFGPAAATIELAESIVKDLKKELPVIALLKGEYGLSEVCMGVTGILGKSGLESISELDLSDSEKKTLQETSDFLKKKFSEI
ncbi:TPA: malate dehydrogenase [archaeon]|jgi:malate dehydrogenase|uniref:Malate dehydrogenase n=1 Tax=Candidatus Undinarchaeum marinum TaxID=2756141 RepID=A0A832V199_9ARCH|nr:malate dehydrogenase [Candidatus Undinarchaeum marinum]